MFLSHFLFDCYRCLRKNAISFYENSITTSCTLYELVNCMNLRYIFNNFVHVFDNSFTYVLLHFYPFKNVKNMSSQITNKIKKFVLSFKLFLYCSHYSVCHLSRLDLNNNNLR